MKVPCPIDGSDIHLNYPRKGDLLTGFCPTCEKTYEVCGAIGGMAPCEKTVNHAGPHVTGYGREF